MLYTALHCSMLTCFVLGTQNMYTVLCCTYILVYVEMYIKHAEIQDQKKNVGKRAVAEEEQAAASAESEVSDVEEEDEEAKRAMMEEQDCPVGEQCLERNAEGAAMVRAL